MCTLHESPTGGSTFSLYTEKVLDKLSPAVPKDGTMVQAFLGYICIKTMIQN